MEVFVVERRRLMQLVVATVRKLIGHDCTSEAITHTASTVSLHMFVASLKYHSPFTIYKYVCATPGNRSRSYSKGIW
jgi:hypothetical protein